MLVFFSTYLVVLLSDASRPLVYLVTVVTLQC